MNALDWLQWAFCLFFGLPVFLWLCYTFLVLPVLLFLRVVLAAVTGGKIPTPRELGECNDDWEFKDGRWL